MFRWIIFSCLFMANFASSNRRAKPTEERIVGGHDRDITVVPHQVSVQYENKHRCGGSIIGQKHILTAAHCIINKDENLFSIRAGSTYHKEGGQKVKVVEVRNNPNFNRITLNYDASVLVLEEPLTFNEKVNSAPLANAKPRPGDMVLISGWGSTAESKRNASDKLLSVVVPVVSTEVCKIKHPIDEITDQMFCAGYPSGGLDSCHGDSGGPAIVRKQLAGIVSWGVGCAQKNSPGVYTSIPSIQDWILEQIRE